MVENTGSPANSTDNDQTHRPAPHSSIFGCTNPPGTPQKQEKSQNHIRPDLTGQLTPPMPSQHKDQPADDSYELLATKRRPSHIKPANQHHNAATDTVWLEHDLPDPNTRCASATPSEAPHNNLTPTNRAHQPRPQRHRAAITAGVAALVATTAALGFAAGRFATPEQKAAESAPPPVVPATAQLTQRVMAHDVVTRGMAIRADTDPIRVLGDGTVTHSALTPGDRLTDSMILCEVNGHPVLAIEAGFGAYRDLHIGDAGRDVTLLKRSLSQVITGISPRVKKLTAADMAALDQYLAAKNYRLPTTEPGAPAKPTPPQEQERSSRQNQELEQVEPTPEATSQPQPYLPASWWAGVAELPSTLDHTVPVVGTPLSSTALATTSGPIQLKITVPEGQDPPSPGTPLTLQATGNDTRHTFHAETVILPEQLLSTDAHAENDNTAAKITAPAALKDNEILLTTAEPIPKELLNKAASVTLATGDATAVLAAPLTAITETPEGNSAAVTLVTSKPGQDNHTVPVSLGRQLGGWVEILNPPTELTEGAVVVLQ